MNEDQEQTQALVEILPTVDLYKTIMVPLKYMRPSDYNPNELDDDDEFEALKKSITLNRDFFNARPILLNAAEGREGIIVGGEKRYKAAYALGWEKAPAMFVLAPTLEKEKAWTLLDNHHNGRIDEMKEKQVFMDLHSAGYDLTSVGSTPMEVSTILSFSVSPNPEEESKAGSIPSKKWLECPECHHQGPKRDFKKIDPSDTDATVPDASPV